MKGALALVVAGLAALPASAQDRVWIDQIGTAALDDAQVLVSDGSNGVFVAGRTGGSLGGPNAGWADAWLARYDAAGSRLWIRQFGSSLGDQVFCAAPDGSGGLFLGGQTHGDFGAPNAGATDAWLSRHDSAGNLLWVRQLGTSLPDMAYCAAPDGSGGVFVGGETKGALGGPNAGLFDAWIARYDGAGNRLWIDQLGSTANDESLAMAADLAGGVYVSGSTLGDLAGPLVGSYDMWLARYHMDGLLLWSRQFGYSEGQTVTSAAPDGSNGVLLGGVTPGSLGGPNAGLQDCWLGRYDVAGNELWIRQFGSTSLDSLEAAAADGSGGLLLSGSTTGSLGGPNAGFSDAWLARHDGAGNQVWIRQLGTSSTDGALAVASDGSGGAVVAGRTWGSLGGPFQGGLHEDAWLARYAVDGSGTTHCSAKTNSGGCTPFVGATGFPSATGTHAFQITGTDIVPDQFGFLLYGINGRSNLSFHNGRLCVKSPVTRLLPPKSSGSAGMGACPGELRTNFNKRIQSGADATLTAGQQVNAQWYYRDPGVDAFNDGLTDAIEFTIFP